MNLPTAILSSLDNVAPRLLPESSVLVDARHLTGHGVTVSELRKELEKLETQQFIKTVRTDLSGVKYRITDMGKGALDA
jgi:hypothetical protein